IKKILSVFIFIYLDFLYFYIKDYFFCNLFVNSNNLFVNLSNLFAISIITGPRHRKNRHIPQLTQNNPIWILVFFPLREFGFNYSCILLFYPLIDDPYFIGNRLLLAKSISLFLFITISSA
ncbi:hypothetical protein ACJX0J_001945, partial [Zea mays]